jgi:ribosomal protein S27AE
MDDTNLKENRQGTVRALSANKRAPEDQELLVDALEKFVNLGDSLEDFQKYGIANPEFFPLAIGDLSGISDSPFETPCYENSIARPGRAKDCWVKGITWEPACHEFVLAYRDACRALWLHSEDVDEHLALLLGTNNLADSLPEKDSMHNVPELRFEKDEHDLIRGWLQIIRAHPDASVLSQTSLYPSWRGATFNYVPANDFQAAVYILFRANWKAKTCPRCGRYFVAGKQAQLYCSIQCHAAVKQARDRQFWKQKGNSLRKTRRVASKSQRKRGK